MARYGKGIAKGMTITIAHLFRRPITVQYPEQKLNVSRRIRGNELVWSDVKCTGCGTCAKTCPIGAIKIVTSVDQAENRYKVEKIEVDTGYCIQCGLCIEACPYGALYLGRSYERAKYRRGEVIQADQGLLITEERKPSAYARPEVAPDMPQQTLLVEKIIEEKHGT